MMLNINQEAAISEQLTYLMEDPGMYLPVFKELCRLFEKERREFAVSELENLQLEMSETKVTQEDGGGFWQAELMVGDAITRLQGGKEEA